jgi:hypothetical protein
VAAEHRILGGAQLKLDEELSRDDARLPATARAVGRSFLSGGGAG